MANEIYTTMQLNAPRSPKVRYELQKLIEEEGVDILCLQEPYSINGKIINLPITAHIVTKGQYPKVAILNLNKDVQKFELNYLID